MSDVAPKVELVDAEEAASLGRPETTPRRNSTAFPCMGSSAHICRPLLGMHTVQDGGACQFGVAAIISDGEIRIVTGFADPRRAEEIELGDNR